MQSPNGEEDHGVEAEEGVPIMIVCCGPAAMFMSCFVEAALKRQIFDDHIYNINDEQSYTRLKEVGHIDEITSCICKRTRKHCLWNSKLYTVVFRGRSTCWLK